MKIKAEHYTRLQALVRVGLTRIPSVQAYESRHESRHESIPRIAQSTDPAKRHRWDALFAATDPSRFDLMADIYTYANDSHVDTALRAIVREVTRV